MSKEFSNIISEYKNRSITVESNPSVIYLESVRGCPYSCVMCSARDTKPVRMSRDLLAKIEPYFKDVEVLTIHGLGEPLLSDLPYFVDKALKNDFVLHMASTGFFLSERIADTLLNTRLSIRFSIHAGRAETYKNILGYDLDKVKRNISYLVNKSNQSNGNHDFWFSCLVLKENIDELEDFLHLAYDCGIKSVRFMRLIPSRELFKGITIKNGKEEGRLKTRPWEYGAGLTWNEKNVGERDIDRNIVFKYNEQYNEEVAEKFIENMPRYSQLAKELGINIESGSFSSSDGKNSIAISPNKIEYYGNKITGKLTGKALFPISKRKGSCVAPWAGQLNIWQDGNVTLCCKAPYVLGNLNDASLSDIWNGEKMKRIRKSFNKGNIPRECGYCNGFDFNEYPHNSFTELDKSDSSLFDTNRIYYE